MSDHHWYFGIKSCGCVVTAVRDDPDYLESTAKYVAGYVRDGLHVERHPHDFARNLKRCRCPSSASETAPDQEHAGAASEAAPSDARRISAAPKPNPPVGE